MIANIIHPLNCIFTLIVEILLYCISNNYKYEYTNTTNINSILLLLFRDLGRHFKQVRNFSNFI